MLKDLVCRSAPTGKAACIINGETLHSMFALPCLKNESNQYVPLENQSLAKLQKTFKSISHVIIDEFSMMSQAILAKIDGRLRQAKCQPTLPFGGLSVILTGDPGQLLPVGGNALYCKKLKNQLNISGYNLYIQFKVVIELVQTMRQQNENDDADQKHFIELLQRTRNGDNTIDDWKLLCKRQPTASNFEEFNNAFRMFYVNEQAISYSCIKINELNSSKTSSSAINSNSKCSKITSDNFGGLTNIAYLAVGAEIVLTANLWTKKGLTNGSFGIIRDIIFPLNKKINDIPDVILMEIYKYNGPKFFTDELKKNWIPIVPVKFFNSYCNGTRQQYAFRLAYATTIHKSQGLFYDHKCILLK